MKLLDLYREQAREHPSEAKYMLVANAIAQGVEEGVLAPGESLPTHRELAETLGVTIGTVSRGAARADRGGDRAGNVRGRAVPRRGRVRGAGTDARSGVHRAVRVSEP